MRAILNKIKKIDAKSDPVEVMDLHEKLNGEEDKLQAAYDEGIRKIHDARELLHDNSNKGDHDE